MTLLLLLTLAVGPVQADPPPLPDRPQPAEPHELECTKSVPLRAGQPVPHELLSGEALACSAVAVPAAKVAHLLELEVYGDTLAQLYELETQALVAERDVLAHELQVAQQPPPWLERPQTQRWLGRLEVVGVVALGAAGGVAVYRALDE